ncbi:hypothetical protein SAMN02745163_00072 [Clostridium cavendishii DSM 21758]|uniref:Uncharacterized protein n=1 Tax=Clostridium cavendishii DSM 21758 TaxID=1121302 RepID=A0A1M6AFU3_9CLOT|nr:hypothetical protein [Clostridium cavendishii]SHI35335.1 hypothetical protein SAMN02745163_00072 [Clostridium cavendishii DSM 21758]
MIRIRLDNFKNQGMIFKMFVDEETKENRIIKRCLLEAKVLKNAKQYPYNVPMKYLIPIMKNFSSDEIKVDKRSLLEFLEFSDEYDENFYYIHKANANYMKKWREVGCPKIYKVIIDSLTYKISKEVVFERLI